MPFYRIHFSTTAKSWFLALREDYEPIDIWKCEVAKDSGPIPFVVYANGVAVDFNIATHGIVVASARLANLLLSLDADAIQLIPAAVEGDCRQWFVVNLLARVDCIDYSLSRITTYPLNHPEKPGKPRGVLQLVLDERRIGTHHIFRCKDWEVVTVVSARVKAAMESMGATGVEYWPVTE